MEWDNFCEILLKARGRLGWRPLSFRKRASAFRGKADMVLHCTCLLMTQADMPYDCRIAMFELGNDAVTELPQRD